MAGGGGPDPRGGRAQRSVGVPSLWQGLVAALDALYAPAFLADRRRLTALIHPDDAPTTPWQPQLVSLRTIRYSIVCSRVLRFTVPS